MSMTWIIIGAVILLFAISTWLKFRGDVSPQAARAMLDEGALLLDVRSAGEFSQAHLPKAKNVPVQELGGKIGSLGNKDRAIVVYCASGARSAMAARMLKQAGFAQVKNLGAMSRW